MPVRNLKREFPEQKQEPPGLEYEMHPRPEIIRNDYKGSEKLKDKIALITGGDSGIGRAVAVHFAREGAHVGIVYLHEEQNDAEETRDLVEKERRRCILIPGDIKERDFCKTAVERIIGEYDSLNILVNNAAEQHPAEFKNIEFDIMENTFRTNIFAMFYLTRESLNYMHSGDSIINSTSVTNYRGSDHLVDYSSTKGAITAFTRSLSKSLAKEGIRVNGVAPGPIWTPLIPSTFGDVKNFGKQTPLGRAGQPSEVAPAYVFLASEDASYITGQIIHPNGGEIVNA
ncbi:MAG TPA: SDR family oxidoreductase [Syntrophorhabdaceae bacterium]|nr:SDR family oxidoreductase [Syntrophorhabdaceae bacterium]